MYTLYGDCNMPPKEPRAIVDMDKEFENMWDYYEVTLDIVENIYGGLPKSPEIIEAFLRVKGLAPEEAKERAKKVMKEIDTLSEEEKAEMREGMWTGFKKDATGLYIET